MTGNVKALTDEELKYALSKYEFELLGDYVAVKASNRKTLHPRAQGFSLLLPLERRRIKVTPAAVDLWEKKHLKKYSLLEVQNAINTLLVTLQKPTDCGVAEQLERTRLRLNNLYREGDN